MKCSRMANALLVVMLAMGISLFADAQSGNGAVKLCAGNEYVIMLHPDGTLSGMGRNDQGQLGDGSTIDRIKDVVVVMTGVRQVSTGKNHTVAVKNDGTLWSWGWNLYGQLGDTTITSENTPVKIMDGVRQVSAGSVHTMAIKEDGSLWGWGSNAFNELTDRGYEEAQVCIPVKTDGRRKASIGRK